MNGEHDDAERATSELGLNPREAVAMLDQTTRRAQRAFELAPPILTIAAAVTVLVGYGAVWLSVRDQQPYTGPSGTALAVLYGVLIVWVIVVTAVLRRALVGRSSQQRRLEAVVFGAIWISVYVFQAALYSVLPVHAIAYGVYAAVAPLIVVGSAAAGYEAARGMQAHAGFAVAAVLLGALAAFAGPEGVWGVVGAGGCALLLAAAAAQLWGRRAWARE